MKKIFVLLLILTIVLSAVPVAAASIVTIADVYFTSGTSKITTITQGDVTAHIKLAGSGQVCVSTVLYRSSDNLIVDRKLTNGTVSQSTGAEFSHTLNVPSAQGYYIKIYVWDDFKNANALTQVVTLKNTVTPPEKIRNLKIDTNASTGDAIAVTWDESEDDLGKTTYNVKRDGMVVASELKDRKFIDDSGVNWYNSFTYTVEAQNGSGQKSESSEVTGSVNRSKMGAILLGGTSTEEKMTVYIGSTNFDWYGYTEIASKGGVPCRRILSDQTSRRLVLNFSDQLISMLGTGGNSSRAKLKITYFADDDNNFRYSYISPENRYVHVNVPKANTNKWETYEIVLENIAGRSLNSDSNGMQDGGVSFSIWTNANPVGTNTDLYVSEIQLILLTEDEPGTGNPDPDPDPDPDVEPLTGLAQDMDGSTFTSIKIGWNNHAQADSYNIYRNGTLLDNIAVNSYEDDDGTLAWYENYRYEIAAVSGGDEITRASLSNISINKSNIGAIRLKTVNIAEKLTHYVGAPEATWYGYTEPLTKDGVECRRIPSGAAESLTNKRLVINFTEAFLNLLGNNPRTVKITVKYFDEGSDPFRVSYISETNRYMIYNIEKTDSKTWKTHEQIVTDFISHSLNTTERPDGLQDGGTYFSIWSKSAVEAVSDNTDDFISEIIFEILD